MPGYASFWSPLSAMLQRSHEGHRSAFRLKQSVPLLLELPGGQDPESRNRPVMG
jgi:hypothetical protein